MCRLCFEIWGALTVQFNFDRVGYLTYSVATGSADKILEAAIEAGADDVVSSDEGEIFAILIVWNCTSCVRRGFG